MSVYSAVSPYRSMTPSYVPPVTKSPPVTPVTENTKASTTAVAATSSPQEKPQSNKLPTLSEALQEQKNLIEKSKQDLINLTLKDGKELSTIEKQLGSFDKQISVLDKQITSAKKSEDQATLMNIEMKLQLDKLNESLSFGGQSNIEQINPFADLQSKSFERIISSAKSQMEGRARVLNREIALDESRFLSGQKSDKRVSLDTLNTKIETLTSQLEQTKPTPDSEDIPKAETSENYINQIKSEISQNNINSYITMQNILSGINSGSKVSSII
ncbi:MAG: hypothetical protein RR048_02135 [Oscillospiraceae bacterium]